METRLVQCTVCGAEIDLITNQCPYCVAPPAAEASPPLPEPTPPAPPAEPAPAAAPPAAVAPPPERVPPPPVVASPPPASPPPAVAKARPAATPVDERDRALGLLLFEAEESLARGAAEKALVLASRAVKDRPESLTARALLERARREMLRGRRRDKLEARVKEAQALLERGDAGGAERIVTSALKLIPDHAMALELFGRIKQSRTAGSTAEAEAERELLALARGQAQQALAAARAALSAGWTRKAVLALKRGLRLVPDDPDLLALLREIQRAGEGLDAERARRNALFAQVRAGLDRLEAGEVAESLRILRAVLREDPDNARAQAAIQEVRRVWLASQPPVPAPEAPKRAVLSPEPAPVPTAARRAEPAVPLRAPPPPRAAPAPASRTPAPRPAAPVIPPEILLPRTRQRATPLALVLGGGLALSAVVFFLASRGGGGASQPSAAPREAPAAPAPTPAEQVAGPLSRLDAPLRRAVEATLASYARALERGDPALLEAARPDMSAAERERRIAPFREAINATTDIRVLDVAVREGEAAVTILSTDVIVGGRGAPSPPLEETLRFLQKDEAWALPDASRP